MSGPGAIPAALTASLAAFDDAALATLANPGLVRRARRDVEEGKVSLAGVAGDHADLLADGQAVRIDVRGPKAATCACKSAAMCRHRIAAVLFLQTAPAASAESPAAPDAADPREVIAALDLAALERWAGKASWRAAREIAGDARVEDAQPHAVAVRLDGLDDPVLILRGQGPDGIVSKAPKARQKAMHAAAVLAARRHFGLAAPAEAELPEAAAASAGPPDLDPAFLARVATALGEAARLGFNLAPAPIEEALFELSVSSRADSLPRLASLLRAIAAQMRLRRARALAFDPDAMLELAATALALTRALGAEKGERRTALAGRVRRDFVPAPRLELIGCGGESWRNTAGARGATAWFVEPATGRWLSTTLARGPGQDPRFLPAEAWRSQSLWQAGPLAELAHARFTLEGANIAADGRLSAPADARATIAERQARPAPDSDYLISDWARLQAHYVEQAGLGLDEQPGPVACLLSPALATPPYFDDLAQQLVWPWCDHAGNWLALTLDHDELAPQPIAAIEALVRGEWRGTALVKLTRDGDRLTAAPMTLFSAQASQSEAVDLAFWRPPYNPKAKSTMTGWLEKLRARRERRFGAAPRSAGAAALAEAWRCLLDSLEGGPGMAGTFAPRLQAHAGRLDDLGLPTAAAALRGADGGEGALAAAYTVMVARQQRCAPPLLAIE